MGRELKTEMALYRFFDEQWKFLYVGVTKDLQRRLMQWRCDERFRQVATMTVQWYAHRGAALIAEHEAIEHEDPAWNKVRYTHVSRQYLYHHGPGGYSIKTDWLQRLQDEHPSEFINRL